MTSTVNPTSSTRTSPSDPARTHRVVTAIALVGSALLVGVGGIVAPPNDGTAEELYDVALSDPGRLTAEAVLVTLSSVLLVVGVIGAARVVRGRGRRLALAAALFGVMGALGHMAFATFSLITIPIVDSASDREAALATLEAVNNDAAVGLLVMPLILAYALSVLLLPIAFYRRRLVPLWVVGLVGAAFLLEAVAPGGLLAVSALKYALTVAAMGVIALRVMRLSDAEWRTPEDIS